MRTNIVHEGATRLVYEIRQIVEDAHQLQALGVEMTWENIGDPIAMGEKVEPWIVESVCGLLDDSKSWAYCPTLGVRDTREFLAAEVNRRGGAQVTPDDILFFNGVADAVDKVYGLLHRNARILVPTPTYPTHSANESKRGGYENVFFHLDPKNGWLPDIEELRFKAKYNPAIAGIALTNPDNPTGLAYSRELLREIVAIAREYSLFLVCDEIYIHIVFAEDSTDHLSTVIEDVPALVMRGVSKEYPWPGARCGWLEIFNADKDEMFRTYTRSLLDAKRMEVCATTLPQMSLPLVFGDSRYPAHLERRAATFARRAREAHDTFDAVAGVLVNPVRGAFYFTILFADGVLQERQTLPIDNAKVKTRVEEMVRGVPNDKRFVYYLMGSEGICVTPLSGFASSLEGFRMTLLETDDNKRRNTLQRLAGAIKQYLGS